MYPPPTLRHHTYYYNKQFMFPRRNGIACTTFLRGRSINTTMKSKVQQYYNQVNSVLYSLGVSS